MIFVKGEIKLSTDSHSVNKDRLRLLFLLLTAFVAMSFFVVIQPFGDGPDEINRYMVVKYVQNHGAIPAGDNPEVIIGGYGASYAFQPILSYIADGFVLRFLKPFNLSFDAELLIARYINVLFGIIAAVYTFKIAALLFKDNKLRFLFSLLVVLLPQNIFIYTYVNTDAMALMSVAMMIYAVLLGYKSQFGRCACINLVIGISLCLLSYYNCYGYVLTAFFAFIACFIRNRQYKDMWKKGLLIAFSVFVLSGWWFIRNAVLYNGDFLALNARKICAAATGDPAWLSEMSLTFKNRGLGLTDMLLHSDYVFLVWKSFIAMFGPMIIPTIRFVYAVFTIFFASSAAGLLIPRNKSAASGDTAAKFERIALLVYMLINIAIPAILAIFYSYTFDYQPQGRYYLPALIPFVYIMCTGFGKLLDLISKMCAELTHKEKAPIVVRTFIYHALYILIIVCLIISVNSMVKFYR